MFSYPVKVLPQADGGFVVSFPDFPEAVTQGESLQEARLAAVDCLDEALANRIKQRQSIPLGFAQVEPIAQPTTLIALKAHLYVAVQEASLSGTALARKLGVAETEARRLLDPRHRTRFERLEEALAAFGKEILVSVQNKTGIGWPPPDFPDV